MNHEKLSGRRRQKLQAVLATGLVLGIGASTTLASWNDDEILRGSFTTGRFAVEGSEDGVKYSDHGPTKAQASLSFSQLSGQLSPNDITTAPFAIRLTADATNDAIVTVLPPKTQGSLKGLTYEVVQTPAFGCSPTTTGVSIVPSGTELDKEPSVGGASFTIVKGVSGAPGAPAFLCFKIRASDRIEQGQSGSATWQLRAESR